MSMVIPSSISPPPASRLARFSVEQYHRTIESGAFTEEDRIELLDGWVVDKIPKNPPHSIVTGNLQDVLTSQLPAGWHIRNQEPITLSLSEPEPDLAIVVGSRNDYANGHPTAANIAVVIEIADTTLADDRWKQHVYAADAVPTYCLLNLTEGVIDRRFVVH